MVVQRLMFAIVIVSIVVMTQYLNSRRIFRGVLHEAKWSSITTIQNAVEFTPLQKLNNYIKTSSTASIDVLNNSTEEDSILTLKATSKFHKHTGPSRNESTEATNKTNLNADLKLHAIKKEDFASRKNPTNSAFSSNSLEWLMSKKLSNEIEKDPEKVWSRILDTADFLDTLDPSLLTERTVCDKSSQFRSTFAQEWDAQNETVVRGWTFRLIYLAIHHLHHFPAKEEAKLRRKFYDPENSDYDNLLSSSDFECPNTKFIITTVARMGFGATFRIGVVNSILYGIALDRVTIFLNNLKPFTNFTHGDKDFSQLSEDWWLTNCPRKDMQCFFLPTTPCTVTEENLKQNLISLPEKLARPMRRQGTIFNDTLSDHPYLFLPNRVAPMIDRGIIWKLKRKLFSAAWDLVQSAKRKNDGPREKFEVLDKALEGIKPSYKDDGVEKNFTYSNRNSMIHAAALLYSMRLQEGLLEEVDKQVSKVTKLKSMELEKTIGMPIRGSDKCSIESTCLSFEKHMQLAHETMDGNTKGWSVVVTSEASDVAKASANYSSSHFEIVRNENDILQDIGYPRHPKYRNHADKVMVSSIVALKLHLLTKVTYGNCCSNFHLLLFDLLKNGCGYHAAAQPICLQETINPEYHVCCKWTETDECQRQWKEIRGK